jgi:GT2 family glycosyltransferase
MSAPVLTVVVPLFQGASYLGETLDSLARQSRRDVLTVVVVDDGSTDGGAALARQHPVVDRVLEQPNRGVAVARNHGLAAASTRWVTFLDQDDLWHPTRAERLLEYLAEPGVDLVATSEIAFALDDEREALAALPGTIGQWPSVFVRRDHTWDDLAALPVAGTGRTERLDAPALLAGPALVTTSFAATPDLLRHAGGFAPHALAMDDYWLLVNAARLSPLVRVDEPSVMYRVHLASTSRETALALPFLTSALALRQGAVLPDAPPGPFHRHLLEELLGSAAFRDDPRQRRVIRHLAAALFADGSADSRVWRSQLKARLPWLAQLRAGRPG